MGTLLTKYIPLKTIASYILDELDKSEADEDRVWILCVRALQKLNIMVMAEPITTELPVMANFTAQYPEDCLQWTKIGLLDNNGQISTLKINNALTTFRGANPNRLNAISTPQINDDLATLVNAPIFLNYYNNGYYNNLFGVRGGLIQYGECRISDHERLIYFPPNFQYTTVLFEYISSPEMNPDFMVDSAFQEAIIAFVKWKLKLGPREDFFAEAIDGRRTLNGKKITLQEVNQFIRDVSGGYLHA